MLYGVWIYGCIDVLMYGRIDGCADGDMGVWMYLCMEVWTHGHKHLWRYGCVVLCMHVWKYGGMDVRMCERVDVWMYGCVDVWRYVCVDVWMYGPMAVLR